ncbi:IS5 family transposase [bacterium]|nr:IS5 family transposase [bacterium]
MPYKHNQDRRHKFEKARYNVKKWPEYDQALKNRGSLTIWLTDDAIKAWQTKNLQKKRGGQPVCSDNAIETGLTLRSLYKLGLRQTEGFLESISSLMGLALSIPDHTTFSRRSRELNITQLRRKPGEPIHILVDSTDLKICGSGEWQETKHGLQKRKHWRKLHLAIDEKTGDIVASELTTNKEDEL